MIIPERPPNFAEIVKVFPKAAEPGVVFAYGEHIFNPSGKALPAAILAHEAVHCARQLGLGTEFTPPHMGPGIWWSRYLSDAEFRYREELAAHVAEYRAQVPGLDRNYAAKLLMSTAARLVAPLYAYSGKGTQQAIKDIRGFR